MSDNRPDISVVIPTYNRSQFVTKAIGSVLAQTYTNYEIIVVDDGSTDDTREILQPYLDKINYISQQNKGVSFARNTGIRAANGEWIAFLDSDDEWLPEKLAVQVKEIGKNTRLCLHTTNAIISDEHTDAINLFCLTGALDKFSNEFTIIERPLKYQIEYGFARTQCTLAKREALINVGLFDTSLTIYEDQDLMCRLALEGNWAVSNRELVLIHRRDELITNLSDQRASKPIRSFGNLVYIYDKLSKEGRLSADERCLVKKELFSCKTGLGMELLKMGQKINAREILRSGLSEQKSLKSLLRYMLSFLPSKVAAKMVRNWHKLRSYRHLLFLNRNYSNKQMDD